MLNKLVQIATFLFTLGLLSKFHDLDSLIIGWPNLVFDPMTTEVLILILLQMYNYPNGLNEGMTSYMITADSIFPIISKQTAGAHLAVYKCF